MGAIKALIMFGSKAEGAMDDLSRMANGGTTTNSRTYAVIVLGELGKAGLPALVELLDHCQAPGSNRSTIPICLTYLSLNAHSDTNTARRAMPALLRLLKDTDSNIRDAATGALRRIDREALEKAGGRN